MKVNEIYIFGIITVSVFAVFGYFALVWQFMMASALHGPLENDAPSIEVLGYYYSILTILITPIPILMGFVLLFFKKFLLSLVSLCVGVGSIALYFTLLFLS